MQSYVQVCARHLRRVSFAIKLASIVAFIGWVLSSIVGGRDLAFFSIQYITRLRFPEVEHLSSQARAEWLSDTGRPRPLLVDVRSREEYDFSHLPGAIHLSPAVSGADAMETLGDAEFIVVYCSVGYRSSRLATRLLQAGFNPVTNLEGSIFAWANAGFPLEKDGHPVKMVHPYGLLVRGLLKETARGNLP